LIKVIVTYSFRHWRSIMTDKNKKSTGAFTEDAENLLKEFWGKVVEYASLGAEEASKVSSTAKTRVDIETLKFKRGLKDSGVAATGTRDLLRQIKRLDADVKKLEKQIAKAQPKTRSKPSATAKAKPETKKRAGSKASTEKKPTKKQSTKKTSTTTKPKTEG
jgi:hypothetical protein